MEDDPLLLNTTFESLWGSVQAVTQQGTYTQLLEREPAVTFSELGSEASFDFECEKFKICDQNDLGLFSSPLSNNLAIAADPPKSNEEIKLELFNSPLSNNLATAADLPKSNEDIKLPTESGFNLNGSPSGGASEFPANNNWPGNFNFDVKFDSTQEQKTKGSAWTYSEQLDKLFVNIASACPIQIWTSSLPNPGSTIRITPVFLRAADAARVVKRCIEHSQPSDSSNQNFLYPDHLIRIENSKARYWIDPFSGRLSVSVPYENPQVGVHFSPYIIRFMCLGSCGGCLARRPLQVIFTLECGGVVIGRRTLAVKMCKCPGRDRATDEKNKNKKTSNTNLKFTRTTSQEFLTLEPVHKRTRFEESRIEEKSTEYTIKVKKRELYEILLKIKESYELAETVSPEIAKKYREKNAHYQTNKNIVPRDKITTNTVDKASESDNKQPLRSITSVPTMAAEDIKQEAEQDILEWLSDINMDAYHDAFVEEGLHDLVKIAEMSHEDLVKMKIGKGHQDILWENIQKLAASNSTSSNSKMISLSQSSHHSILSCSQGSTGSYGRGFTITRYKISHHAPIASDHDYI